MKNPILCGLRGFALLGLLSVPAAQEQEQVPLPILSTQDLVLRYYEVQYVDPETLFEVASDILGRDMYVRERGGLHSDPVPNLRLLGDRLVVFDEPVAVDRILSACAEIDKAASREEGEVFKRFDYRPRYVSLDAVVEALKPYHRSVRWAGQRVSNITRVDERSLVTVLDKPEHLAEIRNVLETVDIPQKEVRLRCYLLRHQDGAESDPSLPADLVSNLNDLVPHFRSQLMGFALLHTTVTPDSLLKVNLGDFDERSYELSFRPIAYDPASGSLSVERCGLAERRRISQAETIERLIFSTNLVFHGSEYTVLGASGRDPVFVVVRIEPVG